MAAPNTPQAKTERLLNLTMALLAARIPVPKQRIRRMVEAYRAVESDEAFDRMFERDKEDLRAMGIPLVTQEISALDEELGYRIDQRDYALPPIELTADELAVVGLASRAWAHAAMGGPAATAWRKVAAGDDGSEAPFAGLELRLGGGEPAFDDLKDAVIASATVRFEYARSGEGGSHSRHVEPWALTAWRGRWYLVGYDLDRQDSRVFRLSRVASTVTVTGEAPTAERPSDLDPTRMIASSATGQQAGGRAELRVRVGAGHGLRRRAVASSSLDGQWDRLELRDGDRDMLAQEIAGYGADVVVEEPAELRDAVVDRLRSVLAAHGGGR